MSENARDIYQANLDAVSKAFMEGDTSTVLNYIGIPNLMSQNDREIVLASPEEFDLVLQDFRQQLLDMGVVDYYRRCTEAEFIPGMTDMIAGRHETLMTYGDDTVHPPFPSRMVLMRYPCGWKGIWLQTEMDSSEIEIISPDIAMAQTEDRRRMENGGR
jgi:hypothetical protein